MFGATAQPGDVIVLVGGSALRVPAASAAAAFEKERELRGRVLRFGNAFTLQVGQSCACNWLHPLDRRLARWLLKVAYRMLEPKRNGRVEVALTQEFLASMLGARIAGINEAMSALTASGLIRHRRHVIEIVNRAGLEKPAASATRPSASSMPAMRSCDQWKSFGVIGYRLSVVSYPLSVEDGSLEAIETSRSEPVREIDNR